MALRGFVDDSVRTISTPSTSKPKVVSRRWHLTRVIASGFLLLIGIIIVASAFIDEPLRRYLERSLNEKLSGYTVTLGGVVTHPLAFSITFRELAISQAAHPEPPVANFPELYASVNWRALLRFRLLGDIVLTEPHVHVNLLQLRHEATNKVPLDEQGWQEALEALFPLKINEFTVGNGDVSYIDNDPSRPLKLTRVNMRAENIRNVRSPDNVYPSTVHIDGDVFDTGFVRVDGQANFLAEPHVGIDADVELEKVQLNYFKPILARMNLWLTDGALWANGHVEYAPKAKNVHLQNLTIREVNLDYVHSDRTAAAEADRAAKVGRAAQELSESPEVPFRVDELRIDKSNLAFVDQSQSDQDYRLFLENSLVLIKNVSNQPKDGPATAYLYGEFMGNGRTEAWATVSPSRPNPDLDFAVSIENTSLRSLNDYLRRFGNFDVTAGVFWFYSQLKIEGRHITGYVKPILKDMNVYSRKQDEDDPLFHQLYEGLVGVIQSLLQNRRDEVGTRVEIEGTANDPKTSTWEVAIGLIRNAFIESIKHGLERDVEEPAS